MRLIGGPKLGKHAFCGVGAEHGARELKELVRHIGVGERRIGVAFACRLIVLERATIGEIDGDACRAALGKIGGALLVELQFDLVRKRLHAGVGEPFGFVGVEADAAVDKRACDQERRREAAFERCRCLGNAGNFERRAIAADADALDCFGRKAVRSFEVQHAIDGGESVAAAAVVLESHLRDVVVRAEAGGCLAPIDGGAHGGAEPGFAFEHVERAGHAILGAQRGHGTGFGGMARVERLRHRIRAEGLLQGRRHRRRCRECVCEFFTVEFEDGGNGGGGAIGADRAGRMPILVVRRLHREADACRDLVADDDRGEEVGGVGALRLCGGQCGADRRASRMVDRVAKDVVEFDGVRGGAVDERCGAQRSEFP